MVEPEEGLGLERKMEKSIIIVEKRHVGQKKLAQREGEDALKEEEYGSKPQDIPMEA